MVDDSVTSRGHYWQHTSTNRFMGLTLPPSLCLPFSLSFCSFIVQTLSPPPPSPLPHNPFRLPSLSSSARISLPAPPPIPSTPLPPLCLCPHLTLLVLNCCRCPFGSGTAGAATESRVPLPPLSTACLRDTSSWWYSIHPFSLILYGLHH